MYRTKVGVSLIKLENLAIVLGACVDVVDLRREFGTLTSFAWGPAIFCLDLSTAQSYQFFE